MATGFRKCVVIYTTDQSNERRVVYQVLENITWSHILRMLLVDGVDLSAYHSLRVENPIYKALQRIDLATEIDEPIQDDIFEHSGDSWQIRVHLDRGGQHSLQSYLQLPDILSTPSTAPSQNGTLVLDAAKVTEEFNIWKQEFFDEKFLEDVRTKVFVPFCYAEWIGRPRGVLLYGPPGGGKTTLAKRMMKIFGGPVLFEGAASNLLRGHVGETQTLLINIWEKSKQHPDKICCIFIDEIESIAGDRNKNEGQAYKGDFTNTLLDLLTNNDDYPNVFVIGATNFKEKLDKAVVRTGRLYPHLYIGPLSLANRIDLCNKSKIGSKFKSICDNEPSFLGYIETRTVNFTTATLSSVLNSAFNALLQDQSQDIKELFREDIEEIIARQDTKYLRWNRFYSFGSQKMFWEYDNKLSSILDLMYHYPPIQVGTFTGRVLIDMSSLKPVLNLETFTGFNGQGGGSIAMMLNQHVGSEVKYVYNLLLPMVYKRKYQYIRVLDKETVKDPAKQDELLSELREIFEEAGKMKAPSLVIIFVDELLGSKIRESTSKSETFQTTSGVQQSITDTLTSSQNNSISETEGISVTNTSTISDSNSVANAISNTNTATVSDSYSTAYSISDQWTNSTTNSATQSNTNSRGSTVTGNGTQNTYSQGAQASNTSADSSSYTRNSGTTNTNNHTVSNSRASSTSTTNTDTSTRSKAVAYATNMQRSNQYGTSIQQSKAAAATSSKNDSISQSFTTTLDSSFLYEQNFRNIMDTLKTKKNDGNIVNGPDIVMVIKEGFVLDAVQRDLKWGTHPESNKDVSSISVIIKAQDQTLSKIKESYTNVRAIKVLGFVNNGSLKQLDIFDQLETLDCSGTNITQTMLSEFNGARLKKLCLSRCSSIKQIDLYNFPLLVALELAGCPHVTLTNTNGRSLHHVLYDESTNIETVKLLNKLAGVNSLGDFVRMEID